MLDPSSEILFILFYNTLSALHGNTSFKLVFIHKTTTLFNIPYKTVRRYITLAYKLMFVEPIYLLGLVQSSTTRIIRGIIHPQSLCHPVPWIIGIILCNLDDTYRTWASRSQTPIVLTDLSKLHKYSFITF